MLRALTAEKERLEERLGDCEGLLAAATSERDALRGGGAGAAVGGSEGVQRAGVLQRLLVSRPGSAAAASWCMHHMLPRLAP